MTVAHQPTPRYTYDDLRAFPEDGQRYEIIGGELLVSPAPSLLHQRVADALFVQIWLFVQQHDLGIAFSAPTDVKFSELDTVEPDIVFVARAHSDQLTPNYVAGAPDLVVEVLSPGSRQADLVSKRHLYARAGVPEYWIVDPIARTLTVLSLDGALYSGAPSSEGHSRALPGFIVSARDIFPAATDENRPG